MEILNSFPKDNLFLLLFFNHFVNPIIVPNPFLNNDVVRKQNILTGFVGIFRRTWTFFYISNKNIISIENYLHFLHANRTMNSVSPIVPNSYQWNLHIFAKSYFYWNCTSFSLFPLLVRGKFQCIWEYSSQSRRTQTSLL